VLALGIKNMRIGPSLPAFISPNIMKMLQERYNLMPIGNPDDDLRAMLGG
jgi:hydroxylamine reductase